ncbi:MAG: hypothetical protein HOB92_03580, partial [Candidatus Cloacimonetes bacterium]|nr:hypothetical protein [Candidatus Cloacimonadota bacterium]
VVWSGISLPSTHPSLENYAQKNSNLVGIIFVLPVYFYEWGRAVNILWNLVPVELLVKYFD